VIAVDTDVIVRLLVADDRRQAIRARRLFEANGILIPTTVLLEAEWVLRSAYDFQPVAIFEAFQKLLGLPQVSLPEPAVVHAALMAYRDGLDFADALHLAGAADAERLATFDRKLLTAARRMSGFIPVVEP
jgi:predicted nucleic-acid-binding protein